MTSQYENITLQLIGMIHSPFLNAKKVPLQAGRNHLEGTIEIFEEYTEGLEDLEGFSHIIIIYYFHLASNIKKLRVIPYLDKDEHGVFATRSPSRPNSLGFAVVRLIGRERNVLKIQGIDMIDQTPVLDLKPFIREIDTPPKTDMYKKGWLEGKSEEFEVSLSDERFSRQ